jgi:hypothetical protein
MLLAHDVHFGIHEIPRYIPKTRSKGLRPARHRSRSFKAGGLVCAAWSGINAQHFIRHFPKVAKISRKKLFTILPNLLF